MTTIDYNRVGTIPHIEAAMAYSRQDMDSVFEEVVMVNQIEGYSYYKTHYDETF